jgi:hypothetical protein
MTPGIAWRSLAGLLCAISACVFLNACGDVAPNSNLHTNTHTNTNVTANTTANSNTIIKGETKPPEQAPPNADVTTVEEARLQIAIHGDLARQYVVKAKQTLAGKPELKQVEEKYRELSATYNGWLKNITTSIATNDKKFEKSPENKKTALAADKKETEFINFVKEKTGSIQTPKSFLALVTVLVKAGTEIWKAHKQIQLETRMAVADYVGKQLKWDGWDDIKVSSDSSPSPTGAATATPSSENSPLPPPNTNK